MTQDYWQQQGDEPLFPDLLWSQPENRRGAGKLLIIGGQAQEFANVAASFAAAEDAGAGTVRVLMPDSTEKVTRMLPNIEYAASNPSGSFSRAALASFLDLSSWADQILLAGDLGRNSETTTILDGFLLKFPCPVTITANALQSIHLPTTQMMKRPVMLVLDFRAMQKLGMEMELTEAITLSTSQPALAKLLHRLTSDNEAMLVCQMGEHWWVAARGRVSSTKSSLDIYTVAARASVWAMQQPAKKFEAVTTSIRA